MLKSSTKSAIFVLVRCSPREKEMVEFLGYLVIAVCGLFVPRFILGLVACWFFGGWWLILLIPATAIGLIIRFVVTARMEKQLRHCVNPECQKQISECNGFVVGRDFLAWLEGKLSAEKVRELCGRCILKFVLTEDTKAFEELLANTVPC